MLELMLLGQAGVLLHYFKEWVLANNRGQKYNLTKALPMALLSSLTTAILVYLKDDIQNLYVVTPFGALVLGYLGNSTFFSFLNVRKPKLALHESETTQLDDGPPPPGNGGNNPPPPKLP